jgi:hypothetical protein
MLHGQHLYASYRDAFKTPNITEPVHENAVASVISHASSWFEKLGTC